MCDTGKPDYEQLKSKLEDCYISGVFPFKHVIIDEGQDFGSEAIEETDIIQLIHDIIVDADQGGTFYVFYDRLQLVQAREMPKFIDDLDCKLTLYRNCRNTENIATTSLRPITERKPKLFEGAVKGAPAKLYFCESQQREKERVDTLISELAADGYKDIVLLTCKTESTSIVSDSIKDGKYRNKYLFTTCRKFKGLEADVVLLIDVDRATFEEENILIFYVGASRARIKLEIAAVLSDDDCKEILTSTLNYQGKIHRAKKDLAGALNAIGSVSF
jgi:DNA helicase IV